MTREYLERMKRLRPIILADTALLERILKTFKHTYEEGALPNDVLILGEGNEHKMYGVGKIRNPYTEQDLHLALRLPKDYSLIVPSEIQPDLLLETIAAYESAHNENYNVPYFAGIVTVPIGDEPLRHAGILTEDLTMGQQRTITPEHPHTECEFFLRDEPDRTKTRFFVDPTSFTPLQYVNPGSYMLSNALVDIRRGK